MHAIAVQNIRENMERMSRILEYVALILSVLIVCLGCVSVVIADSSQDTVEVTGTDRSDPSHGNITNMQSESSKADIAGNTIIPERFSCKALKKTTIPSASWGTEKYR